MLLQYKTTLACRCPICGDLELNKINIFNLAGNKETKIKCDCGFVKLLIKSNNYRDYCLEYICVVCESKHKVLLKNNQLWSESINKIKCKDNGAELGYLGPYHKVQKLAQNEEECFDLMLEQLEFEQYFNNPDIMLSSLNRIHDIAAQNGLLCQCGSFDIAIDMLANEIILSCNNCEGATRIKAGTKKDLSFLEKIVKIEILKGTVRCLK